MKPGRIGCLDPVSVGVIAGYAADRLLGDPHRFHPVAGFGRYAMWLERHLWADSRAAGVRFTAAALAPCALLGLPRGTWTTRLVTTAVTTYVCLGGRSLEREAMAVHDLLAGGDLPGARLRIRSLVGRDTTHSDAHDLARAVLESLAENQSDAVAATLIAAGVGGPGLAAVHRGANTLDAMVGYRTPRYDQFGWASAKFDDVLNLVPARASLVATAAIHAWSQRSPRAGLNLVAQARRQAAPHPSPNAGLVEASAALAQDVRLGGANTYFGVVEDRGQIGSGRDARVEDIPRAAQLSRRIGQVVLVGTLMTRWALRRATSSRR